MTQMGKGSLEAWQDDRLGMFVHWGLYTVGDMDCWAMLDMGTPVAEYVERLEPGFTGEKFDARALAKFAKDVGFRYMVMGARHHEGYCLWDTATTDFSSVRMTPRRDFMAEYTQAAREMGLKVGIYYSLLDWRWQAYHAGPGKDGVSWDAFVDYVHAQIEELMTRYGKIDILWYDGGWGAPNDWQGIDAGDIPLDQVWRNGELNAMVRRHQPGILINDRCWLKEDFGTPEKVLRPEPGPWEFCETMGHCWGASSADLERKSPRAIINSILHCVSAGGNMLLNVGPYADGSLQAWQVETLKEVGRWVKDHAEGIYRCEGETAWPFNSPLAPWRTTRKGDTLYVFLPRYPGRQFAIGNQYHDYRLLNAELVDTGTALQVVHEPTRDVIAGLPAKSPDPYACMVKVSFRSKTVEERAAQASIGLGRDRL